MTTNHDEHEWFSDQIATYLAGGLIDPAEQERFETHAQTCASCAAELKHARAMEMKMSELFAMSIPADDFEDCLTSKLRFQLGKRHWVHPQVRKAAVAAAMVLMLGGIGYVAQEYAKTGRLPEIAMQTQNAVSNVLPEWAPRKASMDGYQVDEEETAGSGAPNRRLQVRRESELAITGGPAMNHGVVAPYIPAQPNSSSPASVKVLGGNEQFGLARQDLISGSGTVTVNTRNAFTGSTTISGGVLKQGAFRDSESDNRAPGEAIFWAGGNNGAGIGGGTIINGIDSRVQLPARARTPILGDVTKPGRQDNFLQGNDTTKSFIQTERDAAAAGPSGAGGGGRGGSGQAGPVGAQALVNNSLGVDPKQLYAIKEPTNRFKPEESLSIGGAFGNKGGNDPVIKENDQRAEQNGIGSFTTMAGMRPLVVGGSSSDAGGGTGLHITQGIVPLTISAGTLDFAGASARPQVASVGTLTSNVAVAQATAPSGGGANANSGQAVAASQAAASARRVIREGTMEFEVESFDSTFNTIATIVGEEGGFIAAADSDKLPNGKVRGMVTVRVPPDRLDLLVLKLRALGELKSQKLGSRDVGKEYTDLESELRAARAMENRLLEMIAKAQGKVADLLEAEKELSNWRTKIEKITGTLNYYNNLISMATLTINAYEKDIRTPASANITEEINAGVETDDVETSRSAALKAIDDAKGRIIESNLQKLEAGQFAAKIVAEVAPENAGPIIDRLKQLGRLARYDVQKKQTADPNKPGAQNARPAVQAPVHLETIPTRIIISMYNLANVAPRLTTNLNLAGDDVEGVYRAILKRVGDANGRVISSNLNRQDRAQVTGAIQFEVKTADADAVLNDIRQQSLVLRMNVTENPDTANVTTAKQAFTLQIVPTAQLTPKLTTNLNLAAEDVEGTFNSILKTISASAGARIVNSSLNRQDATQAVGSIQFEVKSEEAAPILNVIRKNVQVLQLNASENADGANITSIKQAFALQIISTSQVPPREVRTLGIQTSEVEAAMQSVNAMAGGLGGRVIDSSLSQDKNGPTVARLLLEVPLDKTEQLYDAIRKQGTVRSAESSKNNQIPDGPLTRARINLTISTADTIVPSEGGFGASIRQGLSTSVKGLLWSLQLIVIGVCLVAPWALLIWGGWRFAKKRRPAATNVS